TLNSCSRTRQCPSITENLRKVGNLHRLQVLSLRTQRSFFVSVTYLICINDISKCHISSRNTANTATYLNLSTRENAIDDNNLTSFFQTMQLARKQELSVLN